MIAALIFSLLLLASPALAVCQISVGGGGVYLVDSCTNNPVFINGDSPQLLVTQVNSTDAETFIADRAARGFNTLWIILTDNIYSTNSPNNNAGAAPYTGAVFTTENETYWAHVDAVLNLINQYGMITIAEPFFTGASNTQGYLDNVTGSADQVLTDYGVWLGNRYKNFPRLIWFIGGDADKATAGLYTKLSLVAAGIRSVDTNHLISFHGVNGAARITALESFASPPSWLDINFVYKLPTELAASCGSAFGATQPPLMIEDWYEGEHSMTAKDLRNEAYWAVLNGCTLGRVFGNNAIWTMGGPFDTMGQTWNSQLASTGSVQAARVGKIMNARQHWKFAPDTGHTVVTAGYGSGSTLTVTSRTSDGQTIMSYIPNGSAATITVDMTKITSTTSLVRGRWFDPQTGAVRDLGTFANSSTRNFTPPDSNDWILILDDNAVNLSAPGGRLAAAARSAASSRTAASGRTAASARSAY